MVEDLGQVQLVFGLYLFDFWDDGGPCGFGEGERCREMAFEWMVNGWRVRQ